MYLLNPVETEIKSLLESFTFHYVSIKSDVMAGNIGKIATFTFHYVSIKSGVALSTINSYIHLHSTMYLLNPYLMNLSMPIIDHLHSTMYLLNRQITGSLYCVNKTIYIPLCIY